MAYAKFLNTERSADFLGLSKWTLVRWRAISKGPRYSRHGGRIFYDVADLQAFVADNTVDPAA